MPDNDVINGKPLRVFGPFLRQMVDEYNNRRLTDNELADAALVPIKKQITFYGNPPVLFIGRYSDRLQQKRPQMALNSFDWGQAKREVDRLASRWQFNHKRARAYAVDASKLQLDEVREHGFPENVQLEIAEKYIWKIYKGDFGDIVRSVQDYTYQDVPRRALTQMLNAIEPLMQGGIRTFASQIIRPGGVKNLRLRRPIPIVDLNTSFN